MLTPGNAWVGATVTPAASAMRTLLDFSPSSYNYNSMSPAVAGFMLSDLDGSFTGAECVVVQFSYASLTAPLGFYFPSSRRR